MPDLGNKDDDPKKNQPFADDPDHSSAADIPSPGLLADHDLIRRIGRGSYGEVWLCRNHLGAFRAVKFIRRDIPGSERAGERELAGIKTFEPVSRSHEGLVDLLHVGITEDYFYYVMELADDPEHGQEIDPDRYVPKTLRGRLPVKECIQIGLRLSEALHYLHSRGLIHRDIKPSNIIFVGGIPKLADAGLVAHISEARSYVGTEGFIPPEGPGAPRADIYSLGKVLYEIATGKDRCEFPILPLEADDPDGTADLLELNEVIVRACEGRPDLRYQSARHLADDLKVIEAGKSVRRLHLLENHLAAWKHWAKRAAALAAALAVVLFFANREFTRKTETRQREIGTHIITGTHTAEEGNLLGALPPLITVLGLDHADPLAEKTHRLRIAAILQQTPTLIQIWNVGSSAGDLQFSPDGRRLAMAMFQAHAQICDVNSGQVLLPPLSQFGWTDHVSFSPDGRRIVTASNLGPAAIWDATTGALLRTLTNSIVTVEQYTRSAQFSPDGESILVSGIDGEGRAWLWRARDGQLVFELRGHTKPVRFAEFSKDGELILTASEDGTARIWSARNGAPVGDPFQHPNWIYHASFSPDNRHLIGACFDHKAHVWEVHSGREILPPLQHDGPVHRAVFSPDGRHILTTGWDGTARLWEARTHAPAMPNAIIPQRSRVMSAIFAPDSRRLAVSCFDGTVCVWDLAPTVPTPERIDDDWSEDHTRLLRVQHNTLQVIEFASGKPVGPAFTCQGLEDWELNNNGSCVLTWSPSPQKGDPGDLQVWSATNGQALSPPTPFHLSFRDALTNVTLSFQGKYLAIAQGKDLQLYDVATGKPWLDKLSHRHEVRTSFFGPEGKRLFVRCNRRLYVWNVETGNPLYPELTHPFELKEAHLDPTGKLLVTCTGDAHLEHGAAQVFDAWTGQPVSPPLQHEDGVQYAAVSPDHQLVMTGGEDYKAAIWELKTGRRVSLIPLGNQVPQTAFSRDGAWAMTVCRDGTARLWQTESGQPITPPLRHLRPIRSGWFTPDEQQLIAREKNGRAWLWQLPREERSIEDLFLLGAVLGNPEDAYFLNPPLPLPRTAQELPSAWKQLSEKYPESFTVSRDAQLAWHHHYAELSEREKDWTGAAFHYAQLLNMDAQNLAFSQRLQRAQEKLLTSEDPASP